MRYAFYNNGNLTDLHYQRADLSSVQRFQYGYDKNGMRTSMTDLDGLHEYTYDSLYQIIQATHPTVQRPLEQFQYDAVGNWLEGGRVHNELNQLTENDSCWYSYDADGNMTRKVSKVTDDTTHFVWDIENRLVEVRRPGMIARYTYDALGRRMSKEVNGVVTQFRYDGQDLIVEMDGGDAVVASYTFGPGIDNPLVMHRDSKAYYYVKDGLGSVIALTDSTANVVKEYQYSVFGEIIKETGLGVLNPFAYTSREYDAETGNYYYRARFYNARIGRFLSEDPIGYMALNINFYNYCSNSPIAFIDPDGEALIGTMAIGAAAGAIGGYLTGGKEGAIQGAILGATIGSGVGLLSGAIFGSGALSAFIAGGTGNALGQWVTNRITKQEKPINFTEAGICAFGAGIGYGLGTMAASGLGITGTGLALSEAIGAIGGEVTGAAANNFIKFVKDANGQQ